MTNTTKMDIENFLKEDDDTEEINEHENVIKPQKETKEFVEERFQHLKIQLFKLDGFIDIITADTAYIVTIEQDEDEEMMIPENDGDYQMIQGLRNKQKYLKQRLSEVTKKLKIAQSKTNVICIECNVNKSNIVMLPCNHLDVCGTCEKHRDCKICPRCSEKYDQTIIINEDSL